MGFLSNNERVNQQRNAMSNEAAIRETLAIGTRLVRDVLAPMKRTFVGKDPIIDLLGICLIARENLFILGPPGTAKSALVVDLSRRLSGNTFDYLLTRFTEPNELFGPFDIRRLQEGELVTNTAGMLPEAHIVFLDELLNANSAILNSLLTVLNERLFRRGSETRALPVQLIVGASNNLPEDDALDALYDRFLLRVHCENVEDERLSEVLTAGWALELQKKEQASVSIAEVQRLHSLLPYVDQKHTRPAMVQLVRRIRTAGLPCSDRRAVKLQRLVAASALLCGRMVSDPTDLWCFRYIWDSPDQQEILQGLVDDLMSKTPEKAGEHPRARSAQPPNPEELSADLDEVERMIAAASDAAGKQLAMDRLIILAHRCEWVEDEAQRQFLRGRVQAVHAKGQGRG